MSSFSLRVGWAVLAAAGVCVGATVPATSKTTAPSTKSKKKRYRSSVGKPVVGAKKNPVKTAAKKVASTTRRVVAPRAPRVSAATRMEANQGVFQKVSDAVNIPIENAGTLIPFFEQLYRHQKGDMPGPLRTLHYGD